MLGGDADDTERWLRNFATSHARREVLSAEADVEREGEGEAARFGVRVSVGARRAPAAGEPPLALGFPEVAQGRGRLAWCADLAARVRALARAAAGLPGPRTA